MIQNYHESDIECFGAYRLCRWERLKYIKDKVALLYKRYFWVAFGTYWAIYISGFGIIYGVLVTGLVDPGVSWARLTCAALFEVSLHHTPF